MNRLAFLLVTAALFSPACGRQSTFAEKSRIEVTQNADRSWNFKNIGDSKSSGIKATMSLNGGSLTFAGFYAGTLVVVGDTGLTDDAEIDRAEYKIACTYSIQKGTTIEIRTEGIIVPNLEFVRDGRVVADFKVMDSAGKIVMANKRTTDFRNGKARGISFEDATKPKELTSSGGKLVDLRTMSFDLK
jgi:hypothetical protein